MTRVENTFGEVRVKWIFTSDLYASVKLQFGDVLELIGLISMKFCKFLFVIMTVLPTELLLSNRNLRNLH